MLDAVFYVLETGSSGGRSRWTSPPETGSPRTSGRRREPGLIAELHARLRGKVRKRAGREVVDGRGHRLAVREARRGRRRGSRGYGGGRKINGRHRHLICDTAGPLLMINVTAGDSAAELGSATARPRRTTAARSGSLSRVVSDVPQSCGTPQSPPLCRSHSPARGDPARNGLGQGGEIPESPGQGSPSPRQGPGRCESPRPMPDTTSQQADRQTHDQRRIPSSPLSPH